MCVRSNDEQSAYQPFGTLNLLFLGEMGKIAIRSKLHKGEEKTS